MIKHIKIYICTILVLLINLMTISNFRKESAYSYLNEVSFQISMYISKEGSIDSNVMQYIYSVNPDLFILYDEDQFFVKGSVIEYQLGYTYYSLGSEKKEVLISKTSISGAYS